MGFRVHSMDYIFSDPSQIDQRIQNSYLWGRNITRLVEKVKNSPDNIVYYDKTKNQWNVGGAVIDLNKKFSLLSRVLKPFCLRRRFHKWRMTKSQAKAKFEAAIDAIRKAYLHEDIKSISFSSSSSSSEGGRALVLPVQDNQKELEQKLKDTEGAIQEVEKGLEKVQNLENACENVRDKIDEWEQYIVELEGLRDSMWFDVLLYASSEEEELIQKIERSLPLAKDKLRRKDTIQEVIHTLKLEVVKLKQEVADYQTEIKDKGNLELDLNKLLQEKEQLKEGLNVPKMPTQSCSTEVKFLNQLGEKKQFYLALTPAEKKTYKTICQPDPKGPLFTLAAAFFIAGMHQIGGKLRQDKQNPFRYTITQESRKGVCIFKRKILGFDRFSFELPRQMVIEYRPQEERWALIRGPRVSFLKTMITVKDLSISSVNGNIKVHYQLPRYLSVLQNEVNQGIIRKKEDLLTYFKEDQAVVWLNTLKE